MLWQKGLVEREINELLRGSIRDEADQRNKSQSNQKSKVNSSVITLKVIKHALVNSPTSFHEFLFPFNPPERFFRLCQ